MKFLLLVQLVFFLLHDTFSQVGFVQKGRASYYSHPFHGRRTANGEIFDMEAYTAAHKTLPFNSLIKVTNLQNNRWVIVRINDRGPYRKKRILDLSHVAARALNFVPQGTTPIKLEVIGFQSLARVSKSKRPRLFTFEQFALGKCYNRYGIEQVLRGFGVQVGAFENKQNTISTCQHFESKGYKCFIKVLAQNKKRYYRVIVGTFTDTQSAAKKLEKLRKKGWPSFVIPYN